MRTLTGMALGISILMGGTVFHSQIATAAGNMSHAHMEHVMTAWGDTPDGAGLLPTAIAEAKIAAQHAGFAAKKLDNLGWMQTHVRHVLHAIDPAVESKGPGLGYGVIKAAAGSEKHISLAAKSSDASSNVQMHAVHVSVSSTNTVARANEIITLSQKVLAAGTAKDAAPFVKQINALAGQLTMGIDANNNGAITWHKGEGGLNAANKHMVIMAEGEDMN